MRGLARPPARARRTHCPRSRARLMGCWRKPGCPPGLTPVRSLGRSGCATPCDLLQREPRSTPFILIPPRAPAPSARPASAFFAVSHRTNGLDEVRVDLDAPHRHAAPLVGDIGQRPSREAARRASVARRPNAGVHDGIRPARARVAGGSPRIFSSTRPGDPFQTGSRSASRCCRTSILQAASGMGPTGRERQRPGGGRSDRRSRKPRIGRRSQRVHQKPIEHFSQLPPRRAHSEPTVAGSARTAAARREPASDRSVKVLPRPGSTEPWSRHPESFPGVPPRHHENAGR